MKYLSNLTMILLIPAMLTCAQTDEPGNKTVKLPEPEYKSSVSLEETIKNRRSVRSFSDGAVTLQELSQLLWAAQGLTSDGFKRAAPSAGATYPLEVYVAAGNVTDLSPGLYKYNHEDHSLLSEMDGDIRKDIQAAALGQSALTDGQLVIIITGIYERTTQKYGDRGIRYVHIEVGAVAENIYLQCETLGLATVFMGAFHDDKIRKVIAAGNDEVPFALMPIGRK